MYIVFMYSLYATKYLCHYVYVCETYQWYECTYVAPPMRMGAWSMACVPRQQIEYYYYYYVYVYGMQVYVYMWQLIFP